MADVVIAGYGPAAGCSRPTRPACTNWTAGCAHWAGPPSRSSRRRPGCPPRSRPGRTFGRIIFVVSDTVLGPTRRGPAAVRDQQGRAGRPGPGAGHGARPGRDRGHLRGPRADRYPGGRGPTYPPPRSTRAGPGRRRSPGTNALKPGIHCVRTQWIQGLMTFRLVRAPAVGVARAGPVRYRPATSRP